MQFVYGLEHEVAVFGAPSVPCLVDTLKIGNDELFLVNQFIHVVTTCLIAGILVHAMRDNHQGQVGRYGVRRIDLHFPILPIHFDGHLLLLVGMDGKCTCQGTEEKN